MVVNGRAEMTPDPSTEALRQLRLRYQMTAQVSDGYFAAGFTVFAQDVILGQDLAELVAAIQSRPLFVVVLAPRPDAVMRREAARAKSAYDSWTVHALDLALREETPRIGLWFDTSEQTPAETVDEILARAWTEARISRPPKVARRAD
jgi:hypothetical protein